MPPKVNKPLKKKAANGYVMPDPLPEGEILTDSSKKQWKLGPSIGSGGFGEIYSAQEVSAGGKSPKQFVIKIEPHENGPLFVEMHCYMRIAKAPDVDEFCKEKKLGNIGMPVLMGSGTHTSNGKKYRFIVMPKFGSDIWKLYLENKKQFPAVTVFRIGLQMLDVLEYIHSKGYVHADLKGANILLGIDKAVKDQTYLVDFGLASKFSTNKDFKPDPKNAHNGTIEYLSRDAHHGVQTRRGDLEILGYNLIHWLGGVLPWEKNLSHPKKVQESKEASMRDVGKFLKDCFKNKAYSSYLKKYLDHINALEFNAAPDYKTLHSILLKALKAEGGLPSTPLSFKLVAKHTPSKRKSEETAAAAGSKLKKRQKLAATDDANEEPLKTRAGRRLKQVHNYEEDEDEKENDAEREPSLSAKETRDLPKKAVKKGGKKAAVPPAREEEEEAVEDKYAGYTREMIELQKKIEANKLKKGPRRFAKEKAEDGEEVGGKEGAKAATKKGRGK